MDIYWIKDKQQRGPATVPDVIALVQMGELTPDTLGWHAGCKGWAPLRELPALTDFLGELHNKSKGQDNPQEPVITPSSPQPQALQIELTLQKQQAEGLQGVVSLPRPLTRLAARLIDSSLYAALAAGVICYTGMSFTDMLLPLFWAPMIVAEALFLYFKGATPGKMLMGITLSSFGSGQPMTFSRAFFRSLSVNLIGMGCYLFPVCLVTMGISYFLLNRRGITMWDAQSFTLPLQRRRAGLRHFALAFIIIYAAMQLTGYALLMTPGTIEMIEKTMPEAATSIRSSFPNLPPPPPGTEPATKQAPQPLQ